MTPPVETIHVPLWVTVVLLILFFGLPAYFLRSKVKRPRPEDRGIWPSLPPAPSSAEKRETSFFHTWEPRCKLITLFALCFLVVSLDSITACLAALLLSVASVHLSRSSWRRIRRRLLALTGFLAMLLLILPFSGTPSTGETVLLFPGLPGLPFRLSGLLLAATIVCKACTVALFMEPMFGTAPLTSSLQALQQVGMPSTIIQMLLLTHRYLFLFQQEATRMLRSMHLRGFVPRTNLATMRIIGNFLGMLFIRSYERTEHVYAAMLCRGYNGALPVSTGQRPRGSDWAKAGLWFALGVVLLLLDAWKL